MDEQQKQRVTRQIAAALADCAEELSVAAIRELAAINDALRAASYPPGEAGVRAALADESMHLAAAANYRTKLTHAEEALAALQARGGVVRGSVVG